MTTDELLIELQRRVAEADHARRHAQAVGPELVQEKRALRALLGEIKDELIDRYDGAPDSTTRWMGPWIHDLEAFTLNSETIASVTTWANTTFGPATIQRQIERAREEFGELTDLMKTPWGPDQLAEEAADVCICLYRVIGTLDPEAINKKMRKNRARQWKVDGQGCAQHVGE